MSAGVQPASITEIDRRRAAIVTDHARTLEEPPAHLLVGAALFLDFDGTLAHLVDRPDDVVADDELRSLLATLNSMMSGRLAVVSGRSIAQLDAILGPVAKELVLAGSHGCELRGGELTTRPNRPSTLNDAAGRLRPFAVQNPGTLVEEKSLGVALHYRSRPEVEGDATRLARQVAKDLDLHVQEGKMMVEIRAHGGDKGTAVRRMMSSSMMQGFRPIFIGDDLTDEHGFQAAAELGGAGVLVGDPRETVASYRLANVDAVLGWLRDSMVEANT